MGKIMAVVTADKNQVAGGAPIFIAQDAGELQKIAFSLEKILDAFAHDLQNGVMILVDHRSSHE
jgi:hypothetical protein